MTFHDPRKLLDTLRNHLTQPEANIAFLFGAGTSCAVRVPLPVEEVSATEVQDAANSKITIKTRALIPNVAGLTEICIRELRKLDAQDLPPRFGPGFDKIELEVRPSNRSTNVEDILTCIRRKLGAIGATDTLSGLSLSDLDLMEKTICRTIASQVNPSLVDFPDKLPHEGFVRWIARMPRAQPVEIFTTNYDILIETALEAERVPAFDGFIGCHRPFFSHDSLTRPESAPGSGWTRLWKVHGSINWRLEKVHGRARVVRTVPHDDGEMIFPSHHKYDESRKQPYSALLDRLSRVLERDDAILFVCGYSFSDEHINAIIFDALEAKRRPHVIAIQYVDTEEGSVLFERANRYLNLMVLGPRGAVIGGRAGNWRLAEVQAPAHVTQAFKPDETPEGETPSGAGTLLLGDFACFAEFLGSLTKPG